MALAPDVQNALGILPASRYLCGGVKALFFELDVNVELLSENVRSSYPAILFALFELSLAQGSIQSSLTANPIIHRLRMLDNGTCDTASLEGSGWRKPSVCFSFLLSSQRWRFSHSQEQPSLQLLTLMLSAMTSELMPAAYPAGGGNTSKKKARGLTLFPQRISSGLASPVLPPASCHCCLCLPVRELKSSHLGTMATATCFPPP